MSVAISLDRKAVEITWDNVKVTGDTVEIRCVNPDNDDVSNRSADNDGRAVLTFPADYSGTTEVTVSGADGTEDSGTIEV